MKEKEYLTNTVVHKSCMFYILPTMQIILNWTEKLSACDYFASFKPIVFRTEKRMKINALYDVFFLAKLVIT